MTVLDDLRGLESRVATRLRELRPLVEEYRALEEVAQRLGLDREDAAATAKPNARTSTRARRATSKSTRGRRRRSSRQAPNGGRQQQVVDLVKQQPGITVRELGQQLGVDPTSLYRVVRRLEQEGAIKKQGRELQPG
jgi:ribosomal protein S25